MRDLGISIAMDDFGTGYSSLSYLRNFPFDKIKIDKSFIKQVEQHHDSAAIVRAATSLALALDMTAVAEGVETEEEFALVRLAGCAELQGYLISRPMPASEVLNFLDLNGQNCKATVTSLPLDRSPPHAPRYTSPIATFTVPTRNIAPGPTR